MDALARVVTHALSWMRSHVFQSARHAAMSSMKPHRVSFPATKYLSAGAVIEGSFLVVRASAAWLHRASQTA
jgi:hypothetical protein